MNKLFYANRDPMGISNLFNEFFGTIGKKLVENSTIMFKNDVLIHFNKHINYFYYLNEFFQNEYFRFSTN